MTYKQLDKAVKANWISNLRSGDFDQGRKQLGRKTRTEAGVKTEFCCLGVLALSVPGTTKPYWREENLCLQDTEFGPNEFFDEISQIPLDLADQLGLDDSAQNILTHMNDGTSSFAEIADWIEMNL